MITRAVHTEAASAAAIYQGRGVRADRVIFTEGDRELILTREAGDGEAEWLARIDAAGAAFFTPLPAPAPRWRRLWGLLPAPRVDT